VPEWVATDKYLDLPGGSSRIREAGEKVCESMSRKIRKPSEDLPSGGRNDSLEGLSSGVLPLLDTTLQLRKKQRRKYGNTSSASGSGPPKYQRRLARKATGKIKLFSAVKNDSATGEANPTWSPPKPRPKGSSDREGRGRNRRGARPDLGKGKRPAHAISRGNSRGERAKKGKLRAPLTPSGANLEGPAGSRERSNKVRWGSRKIHSLSTRPGEEGRALSMAAYYQRRGKGRRPKPWLKVLKDCQPQVRRRGGCAGAGPAAHGRGKDNLFFL